MSEVPLSEEPQKREKRKRPRWVDAAGLVAAAVIVFAVGNLGGGKKDATPAPSSTTTVAPTTTATSLPVTTSTVTATKIILGQLLPRRTGTVLALVESGRTLLLDLDTGTQSILSTTQPVFAADHGFVEIGQSSMSFFPADGGAPIAHQGVWSANSVAGASSVWVQDSSDLREWIELDGRRGPTGRDVLSPIDAYPQAAVAEGLVVLQHGSLTLLTPEGERRDLGTGDIIAASASTVARVSCERLACAVSLVDLRAGRVRTLDELPLRQFVVGMFSPDGRWLCVRTENYQTQDEPALLLIDLQRGTTAIIGQSAVPFAFSADSSYVITADGGILHAYDLVDRTWADLTQVGTTAATIAATAR